MEKLNVPELTGTNYLIWALKIKSALSLKRLDSVISEVKPENLSEKDSAEWDQRNCDAVAYIKLSLSDEQSLQFATEENAKILWEKIKSTFIGQIEDRKIDAGNEIKSLEMKTNESVNDYIARAKGISTKCLSLGLDISGRELVYYTVRGLRGKFSKIRDILKTQREKSMEEILEILREEENTSSQGSRAEGANVEAFYSRKNRSTTNSKVRLCYVCRRPNHVAKNCFYRANNPNNIAYNENKERKKFPKDSRKEQKQDKKSVFSATSSCENDVRCDNIWILDSGASCHMAKEKIWFDEIIPDIKDIHLAGKDSKIISKGFGTVKAKTVNSKNPIDLTITNVSYVPDLRYNLLSVTCLMDKGCKIKSGNNCVLIFDKDDKFVCKAFKNNNRLEIILEPVINNECCFANQPTNNYEIWHGRLCHLNTKYMTNMKEYIDIDVDNINNFKCDVCDISKITRKPHPNVDIDQSSEIMELVHVDLCGAIKPESFGGAKYFMVFVDDFSGMYFTYFLKSKDEVFNKFCEFKNKYENITGKRIKKVRSDLPICLAG